jgi:hypothetical protein
MAGFVADARQWRKFGKCAAKLFARFRVDVFHTIDVRRTDKDFEDWSVDRKIKFLDEFQHISRIVGFFVFHGLRQYPIGLRRTTGARPARKARRRATEFRAPVSRQSLRRLGLAH